MPRIVTLDHLPMTRPTLSVTALTAIVSLWCLILLNLPLWSHLLELRPIDGTHTAAFLGSFILLSGLAINLFLTPLTLLRPLAKPMLAIVLVSAATANYLLSAYGTVIDKVMIRNALETNAAESTELVSLRMLRQVTLLGILPAVWVLITPLKQQGWRRELRDRTVVAAITLSSLVAVAAAFYQDHASLLRNHRELRHMLVPVNFIAGLGSHVTAQLRPERPYLKIGEDAIRPRASQRTSSDKPVLVVFVVGETARAANFSLGGYPRLTNPALAKIADLVYFNHVSSCGTSTAISVPCLFSDMGRSGFDVHEARHRDNLIDIALRTGLEVDWFGNNTDCKGVCRSVLEQRVDRSRHRDACIGDRPCLDGALFEDFFDTLSAIDEDRFTVIHILGSHGPGYHLRYPAAFDHFKPACHEVDFDRCTPAQIVNAYDNTLLYDDHLLAQTIDRLRALSGNVDTALVYVSDHGESLGENGVFLHALPYALAPRTQTQVPMMFWASAGFRSRFGIDIECLRRESDHSLSHDQLFHSLLDLLSTEIKARRPELDFLYDCRTMTRQKPAT
jgi:lipid A ethanolaminephosphotransferase